MYKCLVFVSVFVFFLLVIHNKIKFIKIQNINIYQLHKVSLQQLLGSINVV